MLETGSVQQIAAITLNMADIVNAIVTCNLVL
jgi:hypothetical protein